MPNHLCALRLELWLPQSIAPSEPAEAAYLLTAIAVKGTALLVDDEELVSADTADMLNELGYAVVKAASGEDAMSLVHSGQSFDLLATDHLMPGMDGTDLALTIRLLRPGTPVLLVSGYAENDGVSADIPRLTKPFRRDELEASVSRVLN